MWGRCQARKWKICQSGSYIKELEIENAKLKEQNKLFKRQLRKFGKVFDRFDKTKEVNDEISAERGQEVESLGGPEDFGIDEHEEDLIEKEKK